MQFAKDILESNSNPLFTKGEGKMEKVMEEISYEASDLEHGQVKIDREYVIKKVKDIIKDGDLSKYIL